MFLMLGPGRALTCLGTVTTHAATLRAARGRTLSPKDVQTRLSRGPHPLVRAPQWIPPRTKVQPAGRRRAALRRGRACPCLRLGAIEIASRRVEQLLYTSSIGGASRASRQSRHAEYEASVDSQNKKERERTMADAAVAKVLGMEDVVIEILTYLPVEQVRDGLMIATSSAFAEYAKRALDGNLCSSIEALLAERFMAAAATPAQREGMSYALRAAGIPIPAAMDRALSAEIRTSSADPTHLEELSACFLRLPDFTRDLCLRLVLAAHETGSVALALKARVCISRMRGNYDSDDSRLSAFLAPRGPLAAARNQAGAAREYCRGVWPEADMPPDWPPARTDWRRVDDGLAPGGRTSAEMQRADRGGPVRNSVSIPAQVIDSGSRERPRRTPRRSGVLCCR